MTTADELAAVRQQACDPLAGPINKENEQQALQTLQEALKGMLDPLLRLPLLAGGEAAAAQGGDGGGTEREASQAAAAAAAAARQGAAASLAVEQQQDGQQGQQAEQDGQQAQQAEQDGQQAQQGGQPQQQGQPPEQPQQGACNENGFDADWRMSRHFCRVYLEGQVAILRRSLQECEQLLAALQA